MTGDPRAQQLPAEIVGILRKPADRRSAKQTQQLLDYCVGQDEMARTCQAERNKIALKVLANPRRDDSRDAGVAPASDDQGFRAGRFPHAGGGCPGCDAGSAYLERNIHP